MAQSGRANTLFVMWILDHSLLSLSISSQPRLFFLLLQHVEYVVHISFLIADRETSIFRMEM